VEDLSVKPLMSAVISKENKMFRVNIIVDRCKECGLCIAVCPTKVLAKSQTLNRFGYHPPEPINIDRCVGCRLCEFTCPDFAIFVERV
jgi:2-oxoglutarate ferredoxin oxidoreductase subunit delta